MKFQTRNGELVLPDSNEAAGRYLANLICNRGKIGDESVDVTYDEVGAKLFSPSLRDAVATPDVRLMLQTAIEVIIREPVEPLMTITPFFTEMQVRGLETNVLAGAMGAMVADDVAEGGQYPEAFWNVGGGMQTTYIGKSGLQISFTDEVLRYATWDIMAMTLREMRNALVRHKERKAAAFLRSIGTELFNNLTPSTSIFGVCTGRGIDGSANATPTYDDLLKAIAFMTETGFPPDTLLVNPQFYFQGLVDPVLRTLFLTHGGGSYFETWNGQTGPRDPWSNGRQGNRGTSPGNVIVPGGSLTGETPTGMAGREHGMTSTPPIPASYFPWNFRVVPSPQVPFDPESETGDWILLSSGNVGTLLVDEHPVEIEWRDEARERSYVRVKERYGFNVAYEGQGVGIMKNVKMGKNYFDGRIQATTMNIDSEIAADADLTDVL